MGKRGPQPGTSYLSASEIQRRGKLSLRGMYPTALSVLSKALNAEDNKPDGEPRSTEDAWGIIHMRDGRPKQQVEHGGISGGASIRFTLDIGAKRPLEDTPSVDT